MAENLFQDLRSRKKKLVEMAEKACDFGWITHQELESLKQKIENDTLTIGVIGQMKSGKSTFLNSFVFENDTLPAATTPMTASLSVITYGDEEKIEAEFYSEDEWQEQLLLSKQDLSSLSESDAIRVKAARELVRKSAPVKDDLDALLGKTREDSLDNLIEYAGANGKYVSITKSVKIYYPEDYLRGVEIVDTPGFNDPIVSREVRTREFLNKADAVVLMLYAGRPFDQTDRTILFEHVRQCGIGKVIICVNKYDIPYEKGETPEEIIRYVQDQIKKECEAMADDTLSSILEDTEIILLSAEMAVLSQLPMSKISHNPSYSHAFRRYASEMDITGQENLRKMSNIDALAKAIADVVEKEKYDILLKKPANAILQSGINKQEVLNAELLKTQAEIKILSIPDTELQEKEVKLVNAQKRLEKKIGNLTIDLDIAVDEIARKGRDELEDAMDICCRRLETTVNSVGLFGEFDNIRPKMDQIAAEFNTKTTRRLVEHIAQQMKLKLKNTTRDFFSEAEDIIIRYIPEVDSHGFVKDIERQIHLQIEDESIFQSKDTYKEKSMGRWESLGYKVINTVAFINLGAKTAQFVYKGINHDNKRNEILNLIYKARQEFDPLIYIEAILSGKERVIEMIRQKFIDELTIPLNAKVSQCKDNLAEKQKQLSKSKEQETLLKDEISKTLSRIEQIKQL